MEHFTLSNTPLDPEEVYVTVRLPKYLNAFSGRILDVGQMRCIDSYVEELPFNAVTFDTDEFKGIFFYKNNSGKYSVWALHETLKYGPEFYINQYKDNKIEAQLRADVIKYLENHKELGLTIGQFL